ncbi:beta-1,3-galactosyltransferase 1-like [Ylistrum balloti]|uniref:beta-1,3-galactosyltransferase 1-like n=1 Tax=Ylistrum balloti TaxID=509963 RepID=UPI00290598EC|nr:beta-1,3-galactosyltransferase 1-like [Ylistrum balloti]
MFRFKCGAMMRQMCRCCCNSMNAISFVVPFPSLLRHKVTLVIIVILVVMLSVLHTIDGDIKPSFTVRREDNHNIEAWKHSMPGRPFFIQHRNIFTLADKKTVNSSTEIDEDLEVVNPHPFRYINNPGHCQFTSENRRTLLVIVKSTVRNILLRQAIRKTWANISESNVKTVFMLGRNSSRLVQQEIIDEEAKQFQDIVQEDFIDAYMNNTLKSIMSFNWATQYCRSAQFLFFVDDDFIVDLPKILNYIYSIPQTDVQSIFTGQRIARPVDRNEHSKWGLSWDVFPHKYWPPYLAGGAYLSSMSVARKFTYAFPYIRRLGIDDAWLGIIARNVQVSPQDHHFFHNAGRYSHLALVYQCCHTPKEMINTWWQYTHNATFQIGKLV